MMSQAETEGWLAKRAGMSPSLDYDMYELKSKANLFLH